MTTQKVNALSLQEKVEVIKMKEKQPKLSLRDIASIFKCGHTQVSNTLKKKEAILKQYEENKCRSRKRLKKSTPNDEINDLTWEWFCKARSKGIPISGPILQMKAKMFADSLQVEKFSASNGWLESFRKRNNFGFNVLSGEGRDVDESVVSDWKKALQKDCEDYPPEDVFNLDETGSFWRALPKKSLTVKDEACQGGKQSKERITILLCTNSIGTEKRKLLVIGKSENPRAFKGWPQEKRPIEYKSNKKAWMTGRIFEDWLLTWDRKLKKKSRKILLFLDNAPCHPSVNLEMIKLRFFPANTTSHTQPLDQGVIKTFKCYYRRRIVERVIGYIDDDYMACEVAQNVNIKDACIWLAESWKEVKPSTIKNCFRKAGFLSLVEEEVEPEVEEVEDCRQIFESIAVNGEIEGVPVEDYINFDNSLATFENIEDDFEKIMIQSLSKDQFETNNEPEEDDEDIEETYQIENTTLMGALEAIRYLKQFAVNRELSDFYDKIENIQCDFDKIALQSHKSLKQKLVTDYFNKQ